MRRFGLFWVLSFLVPVGCTGMAGAAPRESATYGLSGSFGEDRNGGEVRAHAENSIRAGGNDSNAGFDDFGARTRAPALADAPPQPRLLVQKGEVRVEVARPDDAAREIQAKVAEWGGYLQQQNGATLVVRLPAAKFDDAFAACKALGRVLGEARSANDVTEEFVDLGIRIDNARQARDRLVEILKKAEKVEDILKVEAELRRLTEEIERMEGRKKFLQDQVAMATLQVTLQATSEPPPVKRSRQWSRFHWVNRVGAEQMMREDF